MNTKKSNFAKSYIPATERLIDRAIEAGMENDPMLRNNMNAFLSEEEYDEDLFRAINHRVNEKLARHKLEGKSSYPFKPYPKQEDFRGSLKLAKTKVADEDIGLVKPAIWGVNPFDVLSGIILGGKPKVGKTTFIFKLIFTLMAFINKFNLDTSIWLFDNKKDYSTLIRHFPDALVIDSSHMFLNFLEYHEKVGRQKWINNLVEVLCNILYLMEGSSNLLSAAIEELFLIYDATGFNPTITELIKYLARRKDGKSSRINEYRGSITNRIEGILSSTKDIVNVSKGLDFEEDLANRRLVIFSLHDLTPTGQALMTMIPILRIFNYRMALGQRFNTLRNVMIFDEAKRIFPKRAEFSHSGASVSTKLFLESREFGFSFILSDHMINELSDAVKNAYTRVMFRLADYTIPEVARNLYLTKEQAEYFFHLAQGSAIVRYDGYAYPFVIETENVMRNMKIDKNISQAEIETRMNPFWKEIEKSVQPARPEILENYLKNGNNAEKKSIVNSVNEPASAYLNLDSMLILTSARENPFISTVQHYAQAGFSASKGNAAVADLEKKDLIKKLRVKTAKGRGGTSVFLDLTRQGMDFMGKAKAPYQGKGGLKHCYYAKRVADFFSQKGCDVRQEYMDADVAVKDPDGKLSAIEICIHIQNIPDRLISNEKKGFHKSVLIFESREMLEKAQSLIPANSHPELRIIDEYL